MIDISDIKYNESDYPTISKGEWVEVAGPGHAYGKVIRKYYNGENWFGYLLQDNIGRNFLASAEECIPITDKEEFELRLKGEL